MSSHQLHQLDQLPFNKHDPEVEHLHDQVSGPGLADLPTELLASIVAWLLRPEDLARVCLVSRKLRDVALPGLYHSLYLNVDSWSSESLDLLLTRGHTGHRYIRALDIDSRSLKSEVKALKVAKDALELLPRNQLQSFRCPLETGIDNDTMILLTANQRKLAFIGLGPLWSKACTAIPDSLRPWPPRITTIVMPWKLFGSDDIEFYQQLLERCHIGLKALTVRAHVFPGMAPPWRISANDTDTLAKALFSHLSPPNRRPALTLHDLNLQNQNLRNVRNTWLNYVDFTTLQTLQIWNCDNVDELLVGLTSLTQREQIRIHGLILSCEEPVQAPKQAQAYLASTSGLSYLNLCYVPVDPQDTKFDFKCLEPHQSTIRDLYIGIGTNVDRSCPLFVPSIEDIVWLSMKCRHLRQLGIALPPLRIDHALAGHWGRSIVILEELARLPRLKVLRILTWPVTTMDIRHLDNRGAEEESRLQYLRDLHLIATSIANIFACARGDHDDRLSVITFGNAEWPYYVRHVNGEQFSLFKAPITYKIRRKFGEFGLRTKVVRIEADEMEHVEPIAYVVDEDTDQGLCLEAYSWGVRNREAA